MKTYLTIDIGTGSVRVSLFDEELRIYASERETREAGQRVDMEDYWCLILTLMKKLMAENPGVTVCGAAVSSLLGWVAVDEEGNAVCHGWTYLDRQPAALKKFRESYDCSKFYRADGRRLSDEMGALKLAALRDTDPEAYKKTACLLTLKDFINAKLTGAFCTDHTIAGYYMTYDIRDMCWNKEVIEALGLSDKVFPRLCHGSESVGMITEARCREIGLSGIIPVAAGGPDGSVGVLGAGALKKGDAVDISGTTEVLFTVWDSIQEDSEERLVINPHLLPGLWLVGGPTAQFGGTIRWMEESLTGKLDLAALEKEAEALGPGADGVVFLPALMGDRTPYWQEKMRGTIFGLSASHGKAHLLRAIMEASAYTLRDIAEAQKEMGIEFSEMIVLGGTAKNKLWLQIKADTLGVTVIRPETEESTGRGCAMLAKLVAGETLDGTAEAVSKLEPGEGMIRYSELFKRYRKVRELAVSFYND